METKEIYNNKDNIHIFLKIQNPKSNKNAYYSISKENKILILINPDLKNEKNEQFFFDKIFTDNNENSYIYEERVKNSVKESIDKNNFTFICYGNLNNESKDFIFGKNDCYSNINNRGIFLRFLENLNTKISKNKNLNENLSLNISFLMTHENKFIDLSNFIGMDYQKISNDLLKKYLIEYKKDNNYIIKKIPYENEKDVIYFLNKLFDKFENLEIEGKKFLNNSHFSFIIYINDNNGKIISTINFIILGSNNIRNEKYKNELNKIKKDINLYINNKENKKESTLFSLLQKILLNIKDIHHKIIGTINPELNSFSEIKEIIDFISKCKKLKSKDIKIRFSDNKKINYIFIYFLTFFS